MSREQVIRAVLAIALCGLAHMSGRAMSTGLIYEDVELQDGATDGSSCYFKIGNDLILIAMPDSYTCQLLEPLKGKRVEFRVVGR